MGNKPLSQHRLFVTTLKAANPDVNIRAIMDILYESVTGCSSGKLRFLWGLEHTDSLNAELHKRHPALYRYLMLAEEVIRQNVLDRMEDGQTVSLSDITRIAVEWSPFFKTQSNDLSKHFGSPLDTDDDPF